MEDEVAGGRLEIESNKERDKGQHPARPAFVYDETHVELMLEEQPPRVLIVVRVDETEHDHRSNRRRQEAKDRLPLERLSEPMEERDRGGDEEDREDSDELRASSMEGQLSSEKRSSDGEVEHSH